MATPLRIMTMNLGTGSGEPYLDFTVQAHARFIKAMDPDVVFLQEVDQLTQRAGGVDQLAVLRESTPLRNDHFVKWTDLQGGEYGVGIISKFPLENRQNRSVYKPWDWWPYFLEQVIAPVAYAAVNLAGTRLHLYATHFPSNDEGRKKLGADTIAAATPSNVPTVLGGDFNGGPGDAQQAAIDAKFVTTEAIAGRVVMDLKYGEARIDQIYVAGGVRCATFTAVSGEEVSHGRFTDHEIVLADLEIDAVPLPTRRPRVRVEPLPPRLNTPVVVTVFAEDADTGVPVAGTVLLSNFGESARQFNTNTPFTFTFGCRGVGRPPHIEVVCTKGRVEALGYAPASIDFGIGP
jgi:endonuclease/exonuclease/phosphatase family metal-dependent hydrolase